MKQLFLILDSTWRNFRWTVFVIIQYRNQYIFRKNSKIFEIQFNPSIQLLFSHKVEFNDANSLFGIQPKKNIYFFNSASYTAFRKSPSIKNRRKVSRKLQAYSERNFRDLKEIDGWSLWVFEQKYAKDLATCDLLCTFGYFFCNYWRVHCTWKIQEKIKNLS